MFIFLHASSKICSKKCSFIKQSDKHEKEKRNKSHKAMQALISCFIGDANHFLVANKSLARCHYFKTLLRLIRTLGIVSTLPHVHPHYKQTLHLQTKLYLRSQCFLIFEFVVFFILWLISFEYYDHYKYKLGNAYSTTIALTLTV